MTTSFNIIHFDSRHEILANSKRWVFATLASEIIGAISIEDIPDWFWLNDLFVHAHFRRDGIATRLIAEAVEVCRQTQGERYGCNAGIKPENVFSQRAFQANGFEFVSTYGDGARMYSLRLDRGAE